MLKFKTSAFVKALARAGVVPPRPVVVNGAFGFLCDVVGDTCSIYSRDMKHFTKTSCAVESDSGNVKFVFPVESVDSLAYLKDEYLYIEPVAADDKWVVRWSTDSGANAERTTFDPGLIADCSREFSTAVLGKQTPVALLKEGLNAVKAFAAKDQKTARAQDLTLQIFDGSQPTWVQANGHLIATDGKKTAAFYSEGLRDGFLSVHTQTLAPLLSFLQGSESEVKCHMTSQMVFMENWEGDVFGWVKHLSTHQMFSCPPEDKDQLILDVPRETLMNAVKFVRSETLKDEDRMVLVVGSYAAGPDGGCPTSARLEFVGSTARGKSRSYPLVAAVSRCLGEPAPIHWNVSISSFFALVEGAKSETVSIRFLRGPNDTKFGLVRVVESYAIDQAGKSVDPTKPGSGVYQCQTIKTMHTII